MTLTHIYRKRQPTKRLPVCIPFVFILLFPFILVLPSFLRRLSFHSHHSSQFSRPFPLLIYSNPFNYTLKNFIVDSLQLSVSNAGGRVAPCQGDSFVSDASDHTFITSYDLIACSISLHKLNISALKYAKRPLVFATTIIHPFDFFLHSATWLYQQNSTQKVEPAVQLKQIIDNVFGSEMEFKKLRMGVWRSYGLTGIENRSEIVEKANAFSWIIDYAHAEEDVKVMLGNIGIKAKGLRLKIDNSFNVHSLDALRKGKIEQLLRFENMVWEEFSRRRKFLMTRKKNSTS